MKTNIEIHDNMSEKEYKKEQKKGIVFVADHWCEYYGGIDVFNQKLCEAMAYVVDQSKVKVVCLVLGALRNDRMAKYNDIYSRIGIEVIQYYCGSNKMDEDNCIEAVKSVRNKVPDAELIWVGHDLKTGEAARDLSKIEEEKFAVILHTDYNYMHSGRDNDNNIGGVKTDDSDELTGKQNELVREAEWVFCVGPMLYRRFEKCGNNIFKIIPGLEDKQKKIDQGNVIVIGGRYSKSNLEQKNWKDTCRAVVNAINMLPSDETSYPNEYKIYVCGFDENYTDNELKQIKKDFLRDLKKDLNKKYTSLRIPNIYLEEFNTDREKYLEQVNNSTLFIMSSAKESFGLVAWEALALETPIIISKESGVYKHLSDELGFLLNGLCGFFDAGIENTIEEMSICIANILKNKNKFNNSTQLLRQKMNKNRWETVAIYMAKKMDISDVMNEDIFIDSNYIEFTYAKRKLMLDELKKRFQVGKIVKKTVFFGGISREEILLDEGFQKSILEMLCSVDYKKINIYFCYEVEEAIIQRSRELNNADGVNERILIEKSERVRDLKNTLSKLYKKNKYNNLSPLDLEKRLNQIHLVKLKKSPSVYINIVDDDWYYTQKYENRSTQNITVKLSKEPAGIEQKKRFIEHMKFILGEDQGDGERMLLLKELREWEEEDENAT